MERRKMVGEVDGIFLERRINNKGNILMEI